MTVGTTNVYNSSTANGTQVDFTFSFAVQQVGDIEVYQNDVLKTYTTHYSVDIDDDGVGGTVTFVTAPTAAHEVRIQRVVDLTQETALPVDGNIPESTLEDMSDKAIMAIQELSARAIQIPEISVGGVDLRLPAPEAGKTLAWNDDADGLENSDVNGTVTSVDASVSASASNIFSFTAGPITSTGTLLLGAAAALGDMIYASATNVLSKLSGNTSATRKYLGQTGTGAVSAAPTWTTLDAGDVAAGTFPIARGGTNNAALGVGATSAVVGDGSKLVAFTPAAGESMRVNALGTAWESFTAGAGSIGTVTSVDQSLTGLSFITVSGNPVTTAGALALAGSATAGDTLYASATNTWSKLAKGTGLQYLRMNAGATAPEWATLAASGASLEPGGRLTLVSGDSLGSASAAGTLYYTPHAHNALWLKLASTWTLYNFAQFSLALTLTSGSVYDVFAYSNAGTPTLETLVWTNTTTRATAIAYDADTGLMIKSGDASRLYLGTIYATGTNQTSDTPASRCVWNMYQRVTRHLYATDTTNTWNYTTLTWRAANNNTTAGVGRTEFVIGVTGSPVEARYTSATSVITATTSCYVGIALDSTSTPFSQAVQSQAAASVLMSSTAGYTGTPAVGYHYMQSLEQASAGGTATWYGDNGASIPFSYQIGSIAA